MGHEVDPVIVRLFLDRFDGQDEILQEIRTEVKRTNGRVGALEIFNGKLLGALAVLAPALAIGGPILAKKLGLG